LKSAINPERKVALKARLAAATKVQKLRVALKAAKPEQRAKIQIKLAKAKVALKRTTKTYHKVTLKVEAKRVAKLYANIKNATDPARKTALKKQLVAQKRVKELRK
jgi:hypothetical protein